MRLQEPRRLSVSGCRAKASREFFSSSEGSYWYAPGSIFPLKFGNSRGFEERHGRCYGHGIPLSHALLRIMRHIITAHTRRLLATNHLVVLTLLTAGFLISVSAVHAQNEADSEIQVIQLEEGQNLVSLSVTPEDLRIESVLAAVIDDVIMVKDVTGSVFVPRYAMVELADWQPYASYYVYMREARELVVRGTAVDLSSWRVDLDQGWSNIAFPGREPTPAVLAFADLPESVERVEDDKERSYVPGGDSTLETLIPGHGYRVYASEPTSFAYSTPQPSPQSDVYHVPAAIVDDCSVDMTTALHEWIASVPDNSILVFGEERCYNIERGMKLYDRFGLTFEGSGSTFQVFNQGNGQRANWQIWGGGDLVFRDMIAIGANPNGGLDSGAYVRRLEWQHAWRFRGTQGALLDNVEGYDVYGDFVNISFDNRVAYPGPPTRNVTVRNSRFERNGRYGFTITHGENIILENSYIGDVRWSAINIELNHSVDVGRNFRMEGNRFGQSKHHLFVAKGAGMSESVGDIIFRGNVMEEDYMSTCLAAFSVATPSDDRFWSGWVIEDNVFRPRRNGWAIDLTRVRDVVISNNTIDNGTAGGCGYDEPLILRDSHSGNIEGNDIDNGWPSSFTIDEQSTDFVTGNNSSR